MKIKRREFLGFFLFGGLASLVLRKLRPAAGRRDRKDKEAMFWRKA